MATHADPATTLQLDLGPRLAHLRSSHGAKSG